jgi:bifunctional non-homologous end joining protein LigD
VPPGVLPLPKIAPIIPIERPLPFDDPDWLFEPKFDGFRGVLYINEGSATFYSKRGLVFRRFSRLAADVRDALGVRNAILDGEVLAIDETGQHNFRSLMSAAGHLHFAAFDVLWLNGRDFQALPLIKRRPLLEQLIGRTTPILSRTLMVPGEGRDLFEAVKRLDLEGIVCKRADDPYDTKSVWFKVRNKAYSQMTENRFERFSRKR